MKEINGDRDRLGWHIISMGLWIDAQFVCWLLESLDRLSGAARGHILDAAYRSLLIFLLCVSHLFFFLFLLSFSPHLSLTVIFSLSFAPHLPDFMYFITPLVIVITLPGIMF